MDWFINLLECNKSASFRQTRGENDEDDGKARSGDCGGKQFDILKLNEAGRAVWNYVRWYIVVLERSCFKTQRFWILQVLMASFLSLEQNIA